MKEAVLRTPRPITSHPFDLGEVRYFGRLKKFKK
jgi:hypothetical protein